MIELLSSSRGAVWLALILGGTTAMACGDDSAVEADGGGGGTTAATGTGTTTSGEATGSSTTGSSATSGSTTASTSAASSSVTAGDPVAGPTSTSSGDGGGGGDGGNGGYGGNGGEGGGGGNGGYGGNGGEGGGGGNGGSGGVADPLWGCLGNVVWPELEVDPLRVQLTLRDEFMLTNLGGLPVRACARDDLDCALPIVETTSDSEGKIDIQVPATPDVGFEGYFAVGPGMAENGSDVPLNIIMTVRPYTDGTSYAQGIVTSQTLAALMFLGGVEPDPALGHFAAITFRCDDQEADGVTIEALSGADASTTLYLAGGQDPSQGLTMTDGSGVGAIANLEPGRIDVRSELAATGETISLTDVIIRAGAVTSAGLVPTP